MYHIYVDGIIPTELCSSTSISIDVSDTGIDCYSGCLTSSEVLVVGASNQCHDGSIMREFLIAVIAMFLIFMSFTFASKYISNWMVLCVCTCTSAGVSEDQNRYVPDTLNLIFLYGSISIHNIIYIS